MILLKRWMIFDADTKTLEILECIIRSSKESGTKQRTEH